MTKNQKRIIFLNRAFNDLDCRMPLMLAFSRDDYRVELVGIPTNGGYFQPDEHGNVSYLASQGVKVHSIFEFDSVPIHVRALHYAHKIGRLCFKAIFERNIVRSNRLSFALRKAIDLPLLIFVTRFDRWIAEAVSELIDAVVVVDEMAFQTGRSNVLEEVFRSRARLNLSIFAFQTGQNCFVDLWHDKEMPEGEERSATGVKKFIVPSPNDLVVTRRIYPREDIVIRGNTRFDKAWVAELDQLVAEKSERLFGGMNAQFRIVFMLSKIEYGVLVDELVESINMCASIPGAQVVLKPHTRGMSLTELRPRLVSGVIDGTRYSSNELIHWSNLVLFTGSSVVFHALVLGKRVINLPYCSKYKTIFDESDAVDSASGIEHLSELVQTGDLCNWDRVRSFVSEHVHDGLDSGLVCERIKNDLEHWEGQEETKSEGVV